MPLFVSTGRLRNSSIGSGPGRVVNYKSSEVVGSQKKIVTVSIDDMTRAKLIFSQNQPVIFQPEITAIELRQKIPRPLTAKSVTKKKVVF